MKYITLLIVSLLVCSFVCAQTKIISRDVNKPAKQEQKTSPKIEKYTDTINGFSLEFPSTWESLKPKEGDGDVLIFIRAKDSSVDASDKFVPNISLGKSKAPNSNFDEMKKALSQQQLPNVQNFVLESQKEGSIGGIKTYEKYIKYDMSGNSIKQRAIYILKGTTLYVVAATSLQKQYKTYEKDFDSIINSLKITK